MTEKNSLETGVERMSSFHWTAIGICVVLNMIDGFDILVMSYTANSVRAEWNITSSQLGLLLSSGLLGMAIGALFIAPWGDRIGRRKLVLLCISIATVGMTLSGFSQNAVELGVLRLVTGLGIGGLLSCTNVLASEYSSPRWRGLAVSLQTTGFTLGATLGGLASVLMIDHLGWRSVFFVGAGLSASCLIVVIWRLPESVDFLVTDGSADALRRLNVLNRRMGLQPLTAMPERQSSAVEGGGRFTALLSAPYRRSTLTVWLMFLVMLFVYYFVTSWSPRLLIEAGMSQNSGLTGGLVLSAGGVLGTLLFGSASTRFSIERVLFAAIFSTAVLLVLFPLTLSTLWLALVGGLLMGMCISGGIAVLLAAAALTYPASIRATGVGNAVGVGRTAAIASPLVVGTLIDAGWTPTQLYLAAGGVVVVAAVAALTIHPGRRNENEAATSSTARLDTLGPSHAH